MSTFSSRYSGSGRATQEKLQQAAQLAGIADVFGRTAKQAEPVLTLQQSLLGGIVRSQQQEAHRLARRDGDVGNKEGSPRVQQARARTAQLQALVADAVDKARLVGRLADTLGSAGTFAGYVYGENGAPAPEHEVRLQIADKAHGRELASSAKTDPDGYFRMSWAAASKGTAAPISADAGRLAAELLMALAGDDDEDNPTVMKTRAAAAPAAYTTATPAASPIGAMGNTGATAASGSLSSSQAVVRVQVADPLGTVVFEDPAPPAFDTLASEFRTYVVPTGNFGGQGDVKQQRWETKPGS
jgi:hypothetical protein